MSLRLKFNLVMITALLIGLVLAAVLVDGLSQRTARNAVLSEAAIMMGQVNATIHYNDTQVSPLFDHSLKLQFIPQAIPFYAAQRTFDGLSKQFPDYSFRQPTRNPTNPADRPAAWEDDIITALKANPKLSTLVTERKTATGESLSYAQPVRVSSETCLVCHSTPQKAPASMIDVYGSTNGFGWKLGDIVGAEIVSVPERLAVSRARQSLIGIMAGLSAVFAIMMLLLNLLLHMFIIVPIRRISRIADDVSLGNMDAPEFADAGSDEIGTLSLSFNRMRRSLAAAFNLLEG